MTLQRDHSVVLLVQMDAPPGPESLVDKIYDYFEFYPSKAVAIVALALFALASLGILAQTIRSRAWFMLIAVVVGLLEAGGFACRIAMLSHPIRGVYIIMQCLLIIPPSFLALVSLGYLRVHSCVADCFQTKVLSNATTRRHMHTASPPLLLRCVALLIQEMREPHGHSTADFERTHPALDHLHFALFWHLCNLPYAMLQVDYIVLGRLVRAIQQVRTEVAGFQLPHYLGVLCS